MPFSYPEPESKHHGWTAEGVPFARTHYRPAALDESWRKRVAQEKIFKYIEDFQGEMKTGTADSSSLAITDEQVLSNLQLAFRKRDKQKLTAAIEECLRQIPQNQDMTTRILLLKEVLSKSLDPQQGFDSASFLIEAIQPILPADLQETAKETLDKVKAAEAGKSTKTEPQVIENSIYPCPMGVEEFDGKSCTILKAKSTDEDWMAKFGVFGIQPGMLFGCHCSATWEFVGTSGANGVPEEFIQLQCPEHVEFERRYPKRSEYWYSDEA